MVNYTNGSGQTQNHLKLRYELIKSNSNITSFIYFGTDPLEHNAGKELWAL